MKSFLLLFFLLNFCSLSAFCKDYFWVQPNRSGGFVFKVIEDVGGDCSSHKLILDESYSVSADLLKGPIYGFEKKKICGFKIDKGISKISYKGSSIKIPSSVRKFAILGDTGCKVDIFGTQLCYDGDRWPFRKIVRSIYNNNPDIVVHVGDFIYRRFPCPFSADRCMNYNDYGDTWINWEEEFFEPAEDILKSFPVIFVRGNHEKCSTNFAGRGYSWMFENSDECIKIFEPYDISFDNINFVSFDSSALYKMHELGSVINHPLGIAVNMYDSIKRSFGLKRREEKSLKMNKYDLETVDKLKKLKYEGKKNFLLTHIPIWNTGNSSYSDISNLIYKRSGVYNAVSGYDAIFSGDIHLFKAIVFGKEGVPDQFIVGNGGAALTEDNNLNDSKFRNIKINGSEISDLVSKHNFGFSIATEEDNNWYLQAFGLDNEVIYTCPIGINNHLQSCIRK